MLIHNNIMTNKPQNDRFCQYPERALIYSFYNLKYNALRLYLVIAGQKSGFTVDEHLLRTRANITIDEYNKSKQELIEKGFLTVDEDILKITCPVIAYTFNYDRPENQPTEKLNIKDEDYDF